MAARLQTPFFVIAFVVWVFVLLIEMGSSLFLPLSTPTPSTFSQTVSAGADPAPSQEDVQAMFQQRRTNPPRPGYAIQAMAAFDGFVLLGLLWMALALVFPMEIVGRVQGIVSLIVALLVFLVSVVAIFVIVSLLMIMVSLFLAAPFGTLVYLGIWGFFDRGSVAWLLSLDLFLKLVAAILLLFAQLKFIENKGLVFLLLVSVLFDVMISLLQGLPPGVLVSITDAVGAILVLVVTAVWAVVLLVSSLLATLKALKPEVNAA
jgi:hypothetical protein